MSSPAARAVMLHLAKAGGWVPRSHLAHHLKLDDTQLDDELVRLVSAEAVRLNPRGEVYCLAGSTLARKALQRLVSRPPVDGQEHHRELLMAPSGNGEHMRVALALRRPAGQGEAPELVMAEFEIPHHKGCPDKAQAIAHFFAKLGGALGEPVADPAAPAAAELEGAAA